MAGSGLIKCCLWSGPLLVTFAGHFHEPPENIMRPSLPPLPAASLITFLALFTFGASLQPVFAQQSRQNQRSDAPPPPRLEKLEEGEEPAVTIRKPAERKTEEKRAPGGKVTEIKVTNGNSTYYLKPNEPAGSAQPGDQEGMSNRGAQWEILQFDLFGRQPKEASPDAAPDVVPDQPAPVPPPPALPSSQEPGKK
jgi:hypothetical protein